MMGLIKFSCLLLYGMALAGWTCMWIGPGAVATQIVALLILGVHAIEAVIAFKLVRRYPGSLAASVVLTLLFGLLHLRPLEQQVRRMARSDKEVESHGVGKE